MKYWVYINDKVDGPFEEDKLGTLPGFTPETLICAEVTQNGGTQEWLKASSLFEFTSEEQPQLNEEVLKTIHLEETPTELMTVTPIRDVEVEQTPTQLLIEKLDLLTREIEGLKGKVDQAVVASEAAQQAARNAEQAAVRTAQGPLTQTQPEAQQAPEVIVEEGLITNTESLVNHAEQLVAQASSNESKVTDFLEEIKIDPAKTENLAENKSSEELVLRSALDSLYSSKQVKAQTEEEKEATFQDLLSPAKNAVLAAAAAGTAEAALAKNTDGQEDQQQPISEEKREEIINEITAQNLQGDVISQVIDEQASLPSQPAEETPVQESAIQELPAQEPAVAEPTDKAQLDLSDHDQLTISSLEDIPSQPQEQQAPAKEEEQAPVLPVADMPLTPMNPEEFKEEKDEQEETVKELVPGKKLENNEEDGVISQADLDEAFTERPAATEMNFPPTHTEEASVQKETKAPAQPEENSLPQVEESAPQPEMDAKRQIADMTEVELKEGATYLISDFIPPAQANGSNISGKQNEDPANKLEVTAMATTTSEAIEEMVPSEKADDLQLSKVILENTIKMKRGASMDIKTVPMVQEPGEGQRLDLTDSELDINAQHDLKEADFKAPSSGLSKIILGVLISIVFIALIYVMLCYLQIIPASFNFMKPAAKTQQVQQNQNLDDMLSSAGQAPVAQQQPAAGLQAQNAYSQIPQQPMPMPNNVENQLVDQMPQQVTQISPMAIILQQVKQYPMANGQTLQQLINSRHTAAKDLIEWNITTAVEPDNYSIIVKVPPENPQSFKTSYRFNYNTVTKVLDPTISDSKNLLDSVRRPAAIR